MRAGDRVAILSENCPGMGDHRLRLSHARRDRRADLSEPAERSDLLISCAIRARSRSSCSTPEQAAKVAAVRAECSAACGTSSRSPICPRAPT